MNSDERPSFATLCVGQEPSQDRQRRGEAFLRKPLPSQSYGRSADIPAPAIVCVMADGGRFQILDRKQPAHDGEHWRESRIAMFLELKVEVHASDPTPELPAFLRDVSIAKTLAEIGLVPGKNSTSEDSLSRVWQTHTAALAASRQPLQDDAEQCDLPGSIWPHDD
jgi:hypothetical protein